MPLNQTSGNATADGYGVGAVVANYIEDVFSTWLYTGTGASLTITNNIDLSTKGGLTWIKSRSAATDHKLTDTARGVTKALISDTTAAQTTDTTGLTAFGTTGFTIGADANYNTSAATYASWTWRKQAKFFDVVTYTGNGTSQNIAHSLGSVPGCIVVKATSGVSNWFVYHRSLGNANLVYLNATSASATTTIWNNTDPTSTQFSINGTSGNASGVTYVAYLFAHNAGGFGLTGADNVISCGSYTGNGSTTGPIVTLGYEPQWLMVKKTDAAGSWYIVDNMRGLSVGDLTTTSHSPNLIADLANAEQASGWCIPTATGFQIYGVNAASGNYNTSGGTYIYIAIRRGPMKVPTVGTTVFAPALGNGSTPAFVSNFPVSMAIWGARGALPPTAVDRLRGNFRSITSLTDAETTQSNFFDSNTGFEASRASTSIAYMFQRAPSFFDEVCYTGTGANTTITHNLGAVPELIIVKGRSGTTAWDSYCSALANTEYIVLNTTAAKATGATRWNSTTPTSSVFSIGTSTTTNTNAATYVAYLFATCAGVSKVGSYTGNGTTQTINCGFTAGARFVLIKCTSATGDWYVYDTTRGMTTLTDPYFLINVNNNGETATLGSVTTVTTGFALNSAILAAINTNGATYIYLSIA